MADSFKIARIFGIDIELHWSFILLIALILLYRLFYFLLIVILLFVCVLLHELSHSIASRRNGIKVSKIILMIIGGASIIDMQDINPRAEFNIALSGPMTSLLLGGIFGIFVTIWPPGLIDHIFQLLFSINIFLGVTNLLPAFPMDGGRVLRSYYQRKYGMYKATMETVAISKYCLGIIILGTAAYTALTGNIFTLVWMLFIVYFLYAGMKAEEQIVILKKDTKDVRLSNAVSKQYKLVKPNSTAGSIYKLIKNKNDYVVITKIGDAYFLVNIYGKNITKNSKVSDVSVPMPSIQKGEGVVDAMIKVDSSDAKVAVVLDGKKLLGIVTTQQLQSFITLYMMDKKMNCF